MVFPTRRLRMSGRSAGAASDAARAETPCTAGPTLGHPFAVGRGLADGAGGAGPPRGRLPAVPPVLRLRRAGIDADVSTERTCVSMDWPGAPPSVGPFSKVWYAAL